MKIKVKVIATRIATYTVTNIPTQSKEVRKTQKTPLVTHIKKWVWRNKWRIVWTLFRILRRWDEHQETALWVMETLRTLF